ncbi:MAG: Sporulation associated-membrane protein [Candidatus Daviesbacteria bacterium GW2011_GWA2_38_24]|uniref:Sporulation associated-membrane protein n=1 Tax=Candidatus Daviesbacteria bacterium GW2011_GWA2_38_24 TaxID=1618422 RepID=A0A0G0LZU7_9BACT|nr:MAG: Sporulation associated-membrane protein [Candidatus Daviesbacteria bacterium GW2011_GWA2_38_24]KKQ79773.1 MAG: Sporulation associated-membrane protein [Candidatus Daviesbacteria bacterium GW2011_GWA1_38_7]OGE24048.1 MAG: hypothetical protein A2688_01900 [Candidatus Daviesbacteria bacterium RIFCSPHIGHO2_01_FULL_38_8]
MIGDFFNTVFLGPIINLLVLILNFFQGLGIPGALGFAIIVLTVIIRFVTWPFTHAQLKSAKKMADLKPHMDALQKKHKDDKQALAAAQMALYKEHGVNPVGGCLPSLLQIPVIWGLYTVVLALFDPARGVTFINNFLYFEAWKLTSAPEPNFFGINLSIKPSEFATAGIILLLIPLVTAGLQFVQSRMMAPKVVKTYPSDSPKEKKEKEDAKDTMASMQSQMMFMMPLMIGYFAFTLPVAVALYWNTMTIMGIWQQYLINKQP